MRKSLSIILLTLLVLFTLLGIEATTSRDFSDAAALAAAEEDAPAITGSEETYQVVPLACPPLGGYANTQESPNFCVYYNTPPTSDADAILVQGYVDDYWNRYTSPAYGFNAPLFTAPKLEVRIENFSSCNGSAWNNYIDMYDGCFDPANPEFMQYVTGHEVFHRVQFAHDPDWATTWSNSAWIYEGTARNMEDVAFANIDTWANCLTVPFSYCNEVNDYLASTNNDITSYGMRYRANLFWTYFREQFGSTTAEPQRGVDALLELWNKMCCAESVTAVNNTLAVLSPGMTFDDAFRQFTVANWTKDLSGLPDASYNYVDEDQAGNPAPYGPLTPANGGAINTTTSASWSSQSISRYGADYYAASPSAANCPVITASFQRTGGSTEFYHVITQKGSAFDAHFEGSGASWSQSFLNDGVTQIVAIAGAQSNGATVDVEFSCADPVIEIEQPNSLAPVYVGPAGSPDDIIIQVSVTNGSPTGPVVSGLTNADFSAAVGGNNGLILGGGFVQEDYFLRLDTPAQGANGPYALEVSLEEPGTSTVIASDTEADAVIYDNSNNDYVIITDVSGSMGLDNKMQAARDAANLFIAATNISEGLGLVSYNHDVVDTLGIQFASFSHRNNASTQVDAYTASGATSIGDGLDEAVNLLLGSPTGNTHCQFTLLSDGMENSSLFWSDVQTAVQGTGCPVMTIALGPASNELLMQNIASATGGVDYYNDVYPSAQTAAPAQQVDNTALELGSNYMFALCEGQGCERLLSERGLIDYAETMTHTFTVDDSLTDLSVVLDWMSYSQPSAAPQQQQNEFVLTLISPSGVVYDDPSDVDYAFADNNSGHIGFQLDDPETGEWQAAVTSFFDANNKPYQVLAFGQTPVAVDLLLPAVQALTTGDYVPLYAIWRPGGMVMANVTAPDGASTMAPLFDDGQHGDGDANDGFFGGLYTLVTQSLTEEPVQEEGAETTPTPVDEGAYRVSMLATDGDLRRETQGSFTVPGGEDENNDGIPDDYIAEHCPGAPTSDLDLDKLVCADEYFFGTDPNNSDSDFDGESDESEAVRHGLDPLNAGDDMIEAPEYVQTEAQNGSVLLVYDVKGDYNSMIGYRATSPDGPWTLFNSELPLSGVYTDTAVTNDTDYYYCLQAINGGDHWSAVVCSEMVTPREDPVLPEAAVLINDGAASTTDRMVTLSFVASDEGHEGEENAFDDIDEVLISNDPSMSGATWQEFTQDIPWELEPGAGMRTVYVRFRDVNDNESAGTETATILLEGSTLYLPSILND